MSVSHVDVNRISTAHPHPEAINPVVAILDARIQDPCWGSYVEQSQRAIGVQPSCMKGTSSQTENPAL